MKFMGYDSYTSWLITIACLIVNCASQTPYRIVGLLYVAIIDHYETDRETASIPILTFLIVRCLAGPFCGVLGEKLGAENVTLYGSILAAVGFGGCVFANNMIGLFIFLGVMFGLGLTGGQALLPSILKKYFKKNFVTANGISQAGPCVGAIIIPPLAVFLLDKYSLPGMFLITSALMLNALPFCLIIKKTGLIQDKFIETTKRSNNRDNKEQQSVNNTKSLPIADVTDILEQENANNQNSLSDSMKNTCMSDQSIRIEYEDKKPPNISEEMVVNNEKPSNSSNVINMTKEISNNTQNYLLNSCNKMLKSTEDNNYPTSSSETSCEIYNNTADISHQKIDHMNIYVKDTNLNYNFELKPQDFKRDSNTPDINRISLSPEVKAISNIQLDLEKDTKEQTTTLSSIPLENPLGKQKIPNETELHKSAPLKKSKFHYFKVFLNPPFLVIMLSTGLHNYVTVLGWTTIIDYSRDKGISREYEVYFLMMQPFFSLIGRVCFGWVTDLGYLSIIKYSVLCFSLMGLTCGCLVVSADFWIMMLGALTFAMSCGCMTAVFPSMVFSYVPEDLHTMAIASRYALSGPLIFTSAPLIGYFREKHGSYDGLYILFIAICLLCVAIIILMSKFSSRGRKADA